MMQGQCSMTSTEPCRLYEWMTEVGELKTGLEFPTLGRHSREAAPSGLKMARGEGAVHVGFSVDSNDRHQMQPPHSNRLAVV